MNPRNPDSAFERARENSAVHRTAEFKAESDMRAAYFGSKLDGTVVSELKDMWRDMLMVSDARDARSGHLGRNPEGYVLLGLGESGTRKTSVFMRAFHSLEFLQGFTRDDDNSSFLVSVTAPSSCTLAQLGKVLLAGIGAPTMTLHKENLVWESLHKSLPLRGAMVLHIDEAQHALGASTSDLKKVQNAIKGLVQNPLWPCWVILTGLPEAALLVEGDGQVYRRKQVVQFPLLHEDADQTTVREAVKLFGGKHGRLKLEGLLTEGFIKRLVHASMNRLGIAIDLTRWAVLQAYKANEARLEPRHYALAFRRWTGCDVEDNVFTCPKYEKISVGKFLTRKFIEDQETTLLENDPKRAAVLKRLGVKVSV